MNEFSHNGTTKEEERLSFLKKKPLYLRLRISVLVLENNAARNVPHASETKGRDRWNVQSKIKFCVFLIVAYKRLPLSLSLSILSSELLVLQFRFSNILTI